MIDWLQTNFGNRELALYAWVVGFLSWGLTRRTIRDAMINLVRAFFRPVLFRAFLILALYTSAIVYALNWIGYWSPDQLKDTVVWFLGVGLVMFANSNNTWENEHYFRSVIRGLFAVVVLAEYLINLHSFPFLVELVSVPIVFSIVGMKAVSGTDSKYRDVERLLDWLLAAYGAVLLWFSAVYLVRNWSAIANWDTVQGFLLSPILTLAVLPYFYVIAIYALYENISVRIRVVSADRRLARYAVFRIFMKFWLNLGALRSWRNSQGVIRVEDRDDVERLLGGI